MRAYCSESCKKTDWTTLHNKQCKTSILALSDFEAVTNHGSLGRGTYGQVQLMIHRTTKQLFALKTIQKDTNERKVPIKLLYREISIQKRLHHPNVTRLYDHVETSDKVLLFLEYSDGGNLFSHLKRKGKLPEQQACKIFKQICEGVKYLHENNVIHRDLKPDNILLNRSGHVKICDFGWCSEGIHEKMTFCGTLDYMAPEILEGINYSFQIDIWALGVILYELIHGSTPFVGLTTEQKLFNTSTGNFSFSKSSSLSVRNLIKKLLNMDPNLRPSIEEVLSDEWIERYNSFPSSSSNSSITDIRFSAGYSSPILSPVSYQASLTRLGSPDITIKDEQDSNSNHSSQLKGKNFQDSKSVSSFKKRPSVQKRLKRKKAPKTFLSKFLSSFGIS
jgi:serine/threonine protein kinase